MMIRITTGFFIVLMSSLAKTSAEEILVQSAENLSVVSSFQDGTPVKVVCFGDSITGIYYHSGGRRAWSHALRYSLKEIYPQARIEMINAGISGNTTAHGLERIENDVLRHRPQLVVAMFGMNDVARLPAETFRANLRKIVQRIQAVGSEIVLMTPNNIYDEDPERPLAKLGDYAQIVREVATEFDLPLADAFQTYEKLSQTDKTAWIRMMSETIHPNWRGHCLFAAEAASTISGRRIPPPALPPLSPALPHVAPMLAAGKTVRIDAMKPFDTFIESAIRELYPNAKLEINSWDPAGKSITELAELAKLNGWLHYREHPELTKPDLTIVAVPFEAGGDHGEEHYRAYSWVINWAQTFLPPPRSDCLVILPSVIHHASTPEEIAHEKFSLELIADKDLPFIRRRTDDPSTTADLIKREFHALLRD